jgi:hypothetical protein
VIKRPFKTSYLLALFGVLVSTFAHAAGAVLVGPISPPGLSPNGASGITFDNLPNPLVLDGFGRVIWRLDESNATVVATFPLAGGEASARSLAYDQTTHLVFTARDTALATVDPASGAIALLGTMGFFNFESLAVHPVTGELWMANDCNGPACTVLGGAQLWKVNKSTGSASFVRDFSSSGIGQATALAISSAGTFYVATVSGAGFAYLWQVDPVTGNVTFVMEAGLGVLSFINGMVFNPVTQRLYGIEEQRLAQPRAWNLVELVLPVVACSPIPGVPNEKQYVAPWATDLYDSGGTIKKYGCLLTSAVDIINYHAAIQAKPFTTNPRLLNTWLVNNSGYDADGGVQNYAVAKYARDNGVQLYYQGRVDFRNDAVLDSYVCQGQPAIIKVSTPTLPSHYVVATGHTTINAHGTYAINDPGYSSTTMENYAFTYIGIRKFSSSATPLSALFVSLLSPAELLATDSDGRRTGQDATGARFGEIPNSSYAHEDIDDDADINGPPTPEVKSLEILTPTSGTYIVNVVGTGSGSYAAEFRAVDDAGTLSVTKLNGFTIPGAVTSYEVAYSPVPGVPPPVSRKASTIADIIGQVNLALTAGLINNAGIANSLLQKLGAASAAFDRGDTVAGLKILTAFINEVTAQAGQLIEFSAAQLLLEDTQSLRLQR